MTNKHSRTRVLLAAFWKLIRLPIFAYGGLIIIFYIFENRLVFQPTVESGKLPDSLQLNVRHQFIRSNEHKIHLLIVERSHPNCYAIYFHGNGGNINQRSSMLQRLATELNITVIGVSYSGYGYSEGSPSELQLIQDSEAAYNHAIAAYKITANQIMVFGESLGGAIATRLAAKHQIALLALDSTFSSLTDVAQHHYRWLPVHLFMKNRFPTMDHASNYRGRTVQTHGTKDEVVPFILGAKLADQFPGPHEFIIRENGRHNEMPSDGFYRSIATAIDEIFNKKRSVPVME